MALALRVIAHHGIAGSLHTIDIASSCTPWYCHCRLLTTKTLPLQAVMTMTLASQVIATMTLQALAHHDIGITDTMAVTNCHGNTMVNNQDIATAGCDGHGIGIKGYCTPWHCRLLHIMTLASQVIAQHGIAGSCTP